MSEPAVLIVGASSQDPCGVRDHTDSLVTGFGAMGWRADVRWESTEGTWPRQRAALRRMATSIRESHDHDLIVFQWSAFSYAHRGVALPVGPVVRALRDAAPAVIGFLHEPAFHSPRRVREVLWTASQHAALARVIAASDVVAVTSDVKVRDVTRRWLPRRPTVLCPVSATLPIIELVPARKGRIRISVLGFGSLGSLPDVVVRAAAEVASDGPVELVLVGAPGPDSSAADRWRAAAHEARVDDLTFTGILPPLELSRAMATTDVAVFSDSEGPSGRRTMIANAAALGLPTVAVDGVGTWEPMRHVLHVVPPSPRALADGLRRALAGPRPDPPLMTFYAEELAPVRSAARLVEACR